MLKGSYLLCVILLKKPRLRIIDSKRLEPVEGLPEIRKIRTCLPGGHLILRQRIWPPGQGKDMARELLIPAKPVQRFPAAAKSATINLTRQPRGVVGPG